MMAMHCPRCKAPLRCVYAHGRLLWLERTPLPRTHTGGWVIDGVVVRSFAPTTDDPDLPRYAEHRSRCPGVPATDTAVPV